MRYYLDTEFNEEMGRISLISVGIVCEDHRTYYAEDMGYTGRNQPNQWVKENVLPLLDRSNRICKYEMGFQILEFIGDDPAPEFWADFAAYDWVVFCQIWGTMVGLPKHFPMFCRDIQQLRASMGVETIPSELDSEKPHHALYDAWEVKRRYDWLQWQKRRMTPTPGLIGLKLPAM